MEHPPHITDQELVAEADTLLGAWSEEPETVAAAREIESELRKRADLLYSSARAKEAAPLFEKARKLRDQLRKLEKKWTVQFSEVAVHRYDPPLAEETEPLGISSIVAAKNVLSLNSKPILITAGIRFGLARILPEDARLATLLPAQAYHYHLPKDFVGERKIRSCRRRMEELADEIWRRASASGFLEGDARCLMVECPVALSPSFARFSMWDKTVMRNMGNYFGEPSDPAATAGLIQEIEDNKETVLGVLRGLDTGPYTPHQVGSVRGGERRHK